jgi:hypothetical protein
MRLTVTINGTSENPWAPYNLRQNPFPQVPRHELASAMQQLSSLDGDPITGASQIAERLEGWSQEFIRLCQEQYMPGQRVRFEVEVPEA